MVEITNHLTAYCQMVLLLHVNLQVVHSVFLYLKWISKKLWFYTNLFKLDFLRVSNWNKMMKQKCLVHILISLSAKLKILLNFIPSKLLAKHVVNIFVNIYQLWFYIYFHCFYLLYKLWKFYGIHTLSLEFEEVSNNNKNRMMLTIISLM